MPLGALLTNVGTTPGSARALGNIIRWRHFDFGFWFLEITKFKNWTLEKVRPEVETKSRRHANGLPIHMELNS